MSKAPQPLTFAEFKALDTKIIGAATLNENFKINSWGRVFLYK
jgi:hypothetical protein